MPRLVPNSMHVSAFHVDLIVVGEESESERLSMVHFDVGSVIFVHIQVELAVPARHTRETAFLLGESETRTVRV